MTFRASAMRAVSTAIYSSGLIGPVVRAVGYLRPKAGVPILTFHRVNDDADPFFPSLPTAVFAERMTHIARHYRVLTVEELAERLAHGRVPRNSLALTFDDGYRDNLTHAAPVLARLRLPATIFLATAYIGTPEVPWFDRLALAFKITNERKVELTENRTLRLSSVQDRLRALDAALAIGKRLPDAERQEFVERLITALRPGSSERPKRLMLTWDEVDALRGLGFSVGAHTMTHAVLSRVDRDRAWQEIHESKLAVEKALGQPVTAFAYPNGGHEDYNETVTRLVRDAGFTCAVTTRRGLNNLDTSVLELRRGGPWEHHLPTFALKLAHYGATGV